MTPQEFARALRKTADDRERSWNDQGRYDLSWEEAAKSHFEEPWVQIVGVLLYPGYADVWDWCDTVDPL